MARIVCQGCGLSDGNHLPGCNLPDPADPEAAERYLDALNPPTPQPASAGELRAAAVAIANLCHSYVPNGIELGEDWPPRRFVEAIEARIGVATAERLDRLIELAEEEERDG